MTADGMLSRVHAWIQRKRQFEYSTPSVCTFYREDYLQMQNTPRSPVSDTTVLQWLKMMFPDTKFEMIQPDVEFDK